VSWAGHSSRPAATRGVVAPWQNGGVEEIKLQSCPFETGFSWDFDNSN